MAENGQGEGSSFSEEFLATVAQTVLGQLRAMYPISAAADVRRFENAAVAAAKDLELYMPLRNTVFGPADKGEFDRFRLELVRVDDLDNATSLIKFQAPARLEDCTDGNAVFLTVTCLALLNSPEVRALLYSQGYRLNWGAIQSKPRILT